MPTTVVSVHGLADARRTLRLMERTDELRQVRRALRDGAEIVAREARSRVPVRTGRARGGIKAGSSGPRSFVTVPRRVVPYYGWLDFGTRDPRAGQARTVGPWAHSGKGPFHGRYIYRALDAKRGEVVETVRTALNEAIREVRA